ncbi:MAG: hypothetical protein HYV37_00710 [Candidatus Levyibacteriota bacterium]|nr:MAG: hypothetical protein HYV37_00710 [Candidatus Levybacteria bacterium]
MPTLNFEYLPRPYIDNNDKFHEIYKSIIPIRLSSHHRLYPHTIECLLDSGADFNLLPAHIGEKLQIKINKGLPTTHMGIGNVGITAYQHKVKMFIGTYSFETTVDFSFDHRIPILGTYGFFRFFKTIIFNQKELQTELTY